MSKVILTVDDSRTMRDMLNFALADAGFRVTQAVDGLHGLEMLREGEQIPDAIVTDLNMPKLDGFGFRGHPPRGGLNRRREPPAWTRWRRSGRLSSRNARSNSPNWRPASFK
jgi:hypothetical protein